MMMTMMINPSQYYSVIYVLIPKVGSLLQLR